MQRVEKSCMPMQRSTSMTDWLRRFFLRWFMLFLLFIIFFTTFVTSNVLAGFPQLGWYNTALLAGWTNLMRWIGPALLGHPISMSLDSEYVFFFLEAGIVLVLA